MVYGYADETAAYVALAGEGFQVQVIVIGGYPNASTFEQAVTSEEGAAVLVPFNGLFFHGVIPFF